MLFKNYGHHLVRAKIRDIIVDRSDPTKITFNAFYDTLNGLFMAILDYSFETSEAKILSLVSYDPNDLRKTISDCAQ